MRSWSLDNAAVSRAGLKWTLDFIASLFTSYPTFALKNSFGLAFVRMLSFILLPACPTFCSGGRHQPLRLLLPVTRRMSEVEQARRSLSFGSASSPRVASASRQWMSGSAKAGTTADERIALRLTLLERETGHLSALIDAGVVFSPAMLRKSGSISV